MFLKNETSLSYITSPVSPISYTCQDHLIERLGVNLSNLDATREWSIHSARSSYTAEAMRGQVPRPRFALEAIYDGVVGNGESQGLVDRLKAEDLDSIQAFMQKALVDLRAELADGSSGPLSRRDIELSIVLAEEVILLVNDLLPFAEGADDSSDEEGSCLRKNPNRGIRHTLVKAKPLEDGLTNGAQTNSRTVVYEHLNRLTEHEIQLLSQQNPMIGGQATKEGEKINVVGRIEHKFSLGSGGFGRVRIARRIDDNQFVAMKKGRLDDEVPGGSVGHREFLLRNFRNLSRLTEGDAKAPILTPTHVASYATNSIEYRGSEQLVQYMPLGVSTLGRVVDMAHYLLTRLSEHWIDDDDVSRASDELSDLEQHITDSIESSSYIDDSAKKLFKNILHRFSNTEKGAQYFLNTLGFMAVKAVHYLHEKNIAFRDLHLDNIMLFLEEENVDGEAVSDIMLKLIDVDFASSNIDQHAMANGAINNYWGAPEILFPDEGEGPDRIKADLYSLGLMLKSILGTKHIALDNIVKEGHVAGVLNHLKKSGKNGYKTIAEVFIQQHKIRSFDSRVEASIREIQDGLEADSDCTGSDSSEHKLLSLAVEDAKNSLLNDVNSYLTDNLERLIAGASNSQEREGLEHAKSLIDFIDEHSRDFILDSILTTLMVNTARFGKYKIASKKYSQYEVLERETMAMVPSSIRKEQDTRKTYTGFGTGLESLAKKNEVVLTDLADVMLKPIPSTRVTTEQLLGERGYFTQFGPEHIGAPRAKNDIYTLAGGNFNKYIKFCIGALDNILDQDLKDDGAIKEEGIATAPQNAEAMSQFMAAQYMVNKELRDKEVGAETGSLKVSDRVRTSLIQTLKAVLGTQKHPISKLTRPMPDPRLARAGRGSY